MTPHLAHAAWQLTNHTIGTALWTLAVVCSTLGMVSVIRYKIIRGAIMILASIPIGLYAGTLLT